MLKIVIGAKGEKRRNKQYALAEPKLDAHQLEAFSQAMADTAEDYLGEGSTEIVVTRRRKGKKIDVVLPLLIVFGVAVLQSVLKDAADKLAKKCVDEYFEQKECAAS